MKKINFHVCLIYYMLIYDEVQEVYCVFFQWQIEANSSLKIKKLYLHIWLWSLQGHSYFRQKIFDCVNTSGHLVRYVGLCFKRIKTVVDVTKIHKTKIFFSILLRTAGQPALSRRLKRLTQVCNYLIHVSVYTLWIRQ